MPARGPKSAGMSRFDVVGLGQCCIDFLGQITAYPIVDTKCEMKSLLSQGGGPVGTAMVAASRLGLKAALIGKVGDDTHGRDILNGLTVEGVDISGLVVAPDKTSQVAFVAVERGSGSRTVFWTRGTAHPLDVSEVPRELIEDGRLLHLDGLHAAASLRAAHIARAAGIPVMLDAGTFREPVRDLLPLVDYLAVSIDFARGWLGRDDVSAALDSLSQWGARLTCVTRGARGCVARTAEGTLDIPAFEVEVVDTTGCGDAFHGGLIYGVLQDWPARRALTFASAVAAMKCRGLGGRSALPHLREVEHFMAQAATTP